MKTRFLRTGWLLALLACLQAGYGQADSAQGTLLRKKLIWGTAATTVIGHTGLYHIWYLDYPRQSFTWFNDNSGWMQMDKAGHAFSAFSIAHRGAEAWAATGASRKSAAVYGTLSALLFQTPIEVFDGFSAGYGASTGDLIANTAGALMAGFQHYRYGDASFLMRWSYAGSSYAAIRPNMLGSTLPERLLKDYNAQKYWISWHPRNTPVQGLPPWLGVSIGYSAKGMLGAEDNLWSDASGQVFDYTHVPRYRQWFLSPDIRLSRIPVRNKNLKSFFRLLDVYRLPMPALELSRGRLRMHAILF